MTTRERAMRTYAIYAMARDRAELSDFKVSQMTGCRAPMLCDWKYGRYTPKHDKLVKIANLLGIPVSAFDEVDA